MLSPMRASPQEIQQRIQCYDSASENWTNFHIKLIPPITTDLRHNSRLLFSVENSIKNGVTNSRFYSVTHAAEGFKFVFICHILNYTEYKQ